MFADDINVLITDSDIGSLQNKINYGNGGVRNLVQQE